ncbi:hypothetical protein F7725_025540 [Dissostichus mawsoni]|uniref:Uncharacterized protein n=1 Tax=Dissostichus mawsoni TaxID=36200 RepID=A0A7J5XBF3_DISMA|nr:hypothetical protein F7725_025540 [Dissostichus mawsoni]
MLLIRYQSVSFIRSLLTSLTLPPPDPLLQPSISGTDLDKFRKALMALSYRSGGSSGITPHFDFSRSLKPASTSSDDGTAQPERVLGSYSPFHADGALSETLKPAAAPSAGGYSGSHGRQVDGYSPEGSVSSYGPSQRIIRKPNQLPQANPSANGVLQTKAAPWAFPLPHNANSFQSGIASSSAIVMHSGPYSAVPSKPQQPKHLPKPQQAGYKPKPHQPKPQQAANPSNPLQSWYRPKPQQAANPSIPQQAKPYQPSYPLSLQQAANPSNPLQYRYQAQTTSRPSPPAFLPFKSSAGQALPASLPFESPAATNPSSPLQSRYQPKPQHPAYPSNPQQAKPYQPAYPSNPQQPKPQQPTPARGAPK